MISSAKDRFCCKTVPLKCRTPARYTQRFSFLINLNAFKPTHFSKAR